MGSFPYKWYFGISGQNCSIYPDFSLNHDQVMETHDQPPYSATIVNIINHHEP